MKPKNPFSIVNRPVEFMSARKAAEDIVSTALKKQSKTLAMDRVPPGLMEALVTGSSRVGHPSLRRPRSAAALRLLCRSAPTAC